MNLACMRLRGLNESSRSVECLASSEAIDSYGEIVCQKSWKLDRFLGNPIVLFGHNSRELPIGKATNVRVTDEGLCCRIEFATAAANPKAEHVWQAVKEGILKAVSVGFVPGRLVDEKHNGRDVVKLADCELHELSVVPIPANPKALMRARSLGVDLTDLSDDQFEQLRVSLQGATRSASPAARAPQSEPGDDGNGFALARTIFGDEAHTPVDKEKMRAEAQRSHQARDDKHNGRELADAIFGGGE
jgi:HK97 family phage prohead protease